MDIVVQNACACKMKTVLDENKGSYRMICFQFLSELEETVSCYLGIPKSGKKKYPVAITMQGHSTSFYNLVGIKKCERDEAYHPCD